jgi:hypothetical protein
MKQRTPAPGSLSVCVSLATVVIVGTAVRSMVSLLLAGLAMALLASELDRSGRLFGVRVVRAASWLLPARLREGWTAEWEDHVLCAGEEGLRPVLAALGIALIAAPRIAAQVRLRPVAGRYILAWLLVAVEVVRADPTEQRRGSTISAVKAVVRLGALPVTPLLALTVLRRLERALPRWLLYAIGLAVEWCLSWVTVGTPIWIEAPAVCAAALIVLSIGAVVVMKGETIIRFATRLALPPD